MRVSKDTVSKATGKLTRRYSPYVWCVRGDSPAMDVLKREAREGIKPGAIISVTQQELDSLRKDVHLLKLS